MIELLDLSRIREDIRSLQPDPKKKRARELEYIIDELADEILLTVENGVTWKSVSQMLSRYIGNVDRTALARMVKSKSSGNIIKEALKLSNTEAPLEEITHKGEMLTHSPQKSNDIANVKTEKRKYITKKRKAFSFLIAATSPEGKLFQLEHSGTVKHQRGGGYRIFEVTENGAFKDCLDDSTPPAICQKDKAIQAFREWAVKQGYEILSNN